MTNAFRKKRLESQKSPQTYTPKRSARVRLRFEMLEPRVLLCADAGIAPQDFQPEDILLADAPQDLLPVQMQLQETGLKATGSQFDGQKTGAKLQSTEDKTNPPKLKQDEPNLNPVRPEDGRPDDIEPNKDDDATFGLRCKPPKKIPILAENIGDGVLRLNMGPNAADRLYGDVTDGDEAFTVRSEGNTVFVSMPGVAEQRFDGITHIIGDGGMGNDTIDLWGVGPGITMEIAGGEGNDVLYGGGSTFGQPGDANYRPAAVLHGGEGDDEIHGSTGNDHLFGGAGNDFIQGYGGHDRIWGGTGDDWLYGSAGDDILTGGKGDDYLNGQWGSDTYIFSSGWGRDTVAESTCLGVRADIDVLDFSALDNAVTVHSGTADLQSAQITAESTGNTVIHSGFGIEVIKGGQGDDEFHVYQTGTQPLELNGQDGSDRYFAYAGEPVAQPAPVQNVRVHDTGNPADTDRAVFVGSSRADHLIVTDRHVRNVIGERDADDNPRDDQVFAYAAFGFASGVEALEVRAMDGEDRVDIESTPGEQMLTLKPACGQGQAQTGTNVTWDLDKADLPADGDTGWKSPYLKFDLALGEGPAAAKFRVYVPGQSYQITDENPDNNVNELIDQWLVAIQHKIKEAMIDAGLLTDKSAPIVDVTYTDGKLVFSSPPAVTSILVQGGRDNDVITVGGLADEGVNRIRGTVSSDLLEIQGNEGADDRLIVDDRQDGDGQGDTGTLSRSEIRGLDMGRHIVYQDFESVDVLLGANNDEFTVLNTIDGQTLIAAGEGDDTVQVNAIGGATRVDGNSGDDYFKVGGPAENPTVQGINAELIINGDGDEDDQGSDRLDVVDLGATEDNTGSLTATTVDLADMPGHIEYGDVEAVNVYLGTGDDRFNIQGTAAEARTTVYGNDGDDVFTVSSNAPETDGTLDEIAGDLLLLGGAGANRLNVSDRGSSDPDRNIRLARADVANVFQPAGGGPDVDELIEVPAPLTVEQLSGMTPDPQVAIRWAASGTFGQGVHIDAGCGADKIAIESATPDAITVFRGNGGDDQFDIDLDTSDGNGLLVAAGDDGNDRLDAAGSSQNVWLVGDDVQVDYGVDANNASALNSVRSANPGVGGSDTLSGGEGNDVLIGGAAGDTLAGNGGNDLLIGDHGEATYQNNRLFQAETIDFFSGGPDNLDGGPGNDTMLGGFESDLFFGNFSEDIMVGEYARVTMAGDDVTNVVLLGHYHLDLIAASLFHLYDSPFLPITLVPEASLIAGLVPVGGFTSPLQALGTNAVMPANSSVHHGGYSQFPQPVSIRAPEPEAESSYTVKTGDTLWDIAAYYLNDPFLWPEIHKLNPQIENPDLIFPDQVINLPIEINKTDADTPAAETGTPKTGDATQVAPATEVTSETADVVDGSGRDSLATAAGIMGWRFFRPKTKGNAATLDADQFKQTAGRKTGRRRFQWHQGQLSARH